MVRRPPPLHGPRAETYFRLRRQSVVFRFLLQHDAGEPEGVQILLGYGEPEVERKVRFTGPAGYRTRRLVAVLLLPSRARPRVSQEIVWRHAAGIRPGSTANYRLAGAGQIPALYRLSRHEPGENPGFARRGTRQRRLEGGSPADVGRRLDEFNQ